MYNSNDYVNAVQYSGASSDYTHMAPIYNVLGYGSDGSYTPSVFDPLGSSSSAGYNYTTGYGYQAPSNLVLGMSAAAGIFGAIGNIITANERADAQKEMQERQYAAFQQQYSSQQKQAQFQQSIQSIIQMKMMMKYLENQ